MILLLRSLCASAVALIDYNCVKLGKLVSYNGAVCEATRYGLDGPGIESR